MSVLVPVRFWKNASWSIASLLERFSGKTLRAMGEFRQLANLHPAYRDVDDIGIKFTQTYIEARVQLTDQNLLRKWRPDIDVVGTEHIDAALMSNKGVILWVTPFAFSDLVAKMAMKQSGYEISHLSRPGHGFSRSRFGVRFLNGLRTRVENRYIKDRVRIHTGEERRAMLALRRVLKNNGIVSITVGAQSKKSDQVNLRAGKLRIATGALRLSELTGAPVLPVFTVNTSAQEYKVDIGSSITGTGSGHAESLKTYAELLEEYLSNYPCQWRAMYDFVVDSPAAD